jgi:enoyl-CoA hydratase/carnithine racemase
MTAATEFETVSLRVEDGVAVMTLNRPDKMNAFNPTMRDDLLAAFDRTDADDDVRAVVLTGAGKAFCAGADLSGRGFTAAQSQAGVEVPRLTRDSAGMVTLRIFDSRKPVIAAVNGAAIGFGATVTLAADIRLGSTRTRYGFVFARRGIVPDGCASWFLPRIVGISRAARWSYTGDLISGDELVSSGLVDELHAPEELLPAALRLAGEIAANTAPVSVAVTRQLLWRMLTVNHPMEAHIAESRALYGRVRSADAAEGVASFLDRRPAVFPLRVSTSMPDVFDPEAVPAGFPDEPAAERYVPPEPPEPARPAGAGAGVRALLAGGREPGHHHIEESHP